MEGADESQALVEAERRRLGLRTYRRAYLDSDQPFESGLDL